MFATAERLSQLGVCASNACCVKMEIKNIFFFNGKSLRIFIQ